MLRILYILSMAVAVTFKFNGETTYFYTKYFIAAGWTALWFADMLLRERYMKKQNLFFFKAVSIPPIIILLWSVVLWIINPQPRLTGAVMQTTLSNILALFLATTCAIAAAHFFGKQAILYSGIAVAISTIANIIVVLPKYGVSTFIEYLKTAFVVTNLDYTSNITRLSLDLEVHDSTVACGAFIIYYLFFYKKIEYDSQETHWSFEKVFMLSVLVFCFYTGFKRLVLYGVIGVCVVMFFLIIRKKSLLSVIKGFSLVYIIFCFAYVAGLKFGLVEQIANIIGINFSGRFNFYGMLTDFYNICPFYIGTGYGYINNIMYADTGFQSHTDIVRMYAELGFIPYLLWLVHYLRRLPLQIHHLYGDECTKAYLATTVYIFITYLAGNTMNLFASQFSYILVPIAIAFGDKEPKHKRVVLRR